MNDDKIEIEASIRNFIAKQLLYSLEGFGYDDDASLLGEQIIDSLGVVALSAFLEQQFRIKVEQKHLRPENFDSVNKLAAFVRRAVGAHETAAASA